MARQVRRQDLKVVPLSFPPWAPLSMVPGLCRCGKCSGILDREDVVGYTDQGR